MWAKLLANGTYYHNSVSVGLSDKRGNWKLPRHLQTILGTLNLYFWLATWSNLGPLIGAVWFPPRKESTNEQVRKGNWKDQTDFYTVTVAYVDFNMMVIFTHLWDGNEFWSRWVSNGLASTEPSLIDHCHQWFFNGYPQIFVSWSTMVLACLKDLKKLAIATYPILWQIHLMIEKGDK